MQVYFTTEKPHPIDKRDMHGSGHKRIGIKKSHLSQSDEQEIKVCTVRRVRTQVRSAAEI